MHFTGKFSFFIVFLWFLIYTYNKYSMIGVGDLSDAVWGLDGDGTARNKRVW